MQSPFFICFLWHPLCTVGHSRLCIEWVVLLKCHVVTALAPDIGRLWLARRMMFGFQWQKQGLLLPMLVAWLDELRSHFEEMGAILPSLSPVKPSSEKLCGWWIVDCLQLPCSCCVLWKSPRPCPTCWCQSSSIRRRCRGWTPSSSFTRSGGFAIRSGPGWRREHSRFSRWGILPTWQLD